LLILLTCFACAEPFQPTETSSATNILVVDGLVDATDNSITVQLSRSKSLTDTGPVQAESNARVVVETSTGATYTLSEVVSGTYSIHSADIQKGPSYTLRIRTGDGTDYFSEAVQIEDTPPIDSIGYKLSNDKQGLTILANTHNENTTSGYYAWTFTETYEYKAAFYSGYHFENRTPELRKSGEGIYTCWRTVESKEIYIGSSSGLSQDIISGHELFTIEKASPKTSVRYSILLKQRSISESEYTYLQLLKNTTENLGSLFDPTPGTVDGNMHQANDDKAVVLGYFTAATFTEKRVFISHGDLPVELQVPVKYPGCQIETTCLLVPRPVSFPRSCITLANLSDAAVIISAEFDETGGVIAYNFASAECGDCRTQGGVTVAPDFW
jgi:hypothetical protein